MAQRLSIALLFVSAACGVASCAAETGNLQANIALPSNVAPPDRLAEPWRPPEPTRATGFPAVTVLWANTIAPGHSAAEPVLVARLDRPLPPRIEPRPDPEPDVAPDPQPEPDPVPDPEPDPEPDPKPDPDPEPTLPAADPGGEPDLPSDLVLPTRLADASTDETKFHTQAERVLTKLYRTDSDDPSILLSMYEKLLTDEELTGVQDDWQVPLEKGIARAETLQRVNAAMSGLRGAFASAKPGAGPTLFTGIDQPQCRSAFAHLYKSDPSAIDLAVNMPPLGRRKLSDVETICKESNAAELADRSFPAPQGPARLRKLVKKSYKKAYRKRAIKKVHLPTAAWEVIEGEDRRVLRAIVGVRRKNVFPEAPCVMEEIIIEQRKKRRRFGRPVCCQIESSVPIACSELERR